MRYYNEKSNEILTVGGVRRAVYPSIPANNFTPTQVEYFGIKELIETEKPTASSDLKVVVSGDPIKTDSGAWATTWVEVDRFTDIPDGETQAEQETAYLQELTATEIADKKAELLEAIEEKRITQCENFPFVKDGVKIIVKIKEEPPNKPRLTWVGNTAAWGEMMVSENDTTSTEKLIAHDDSLHTLITVEWRELGKQLKVWLSQNIQASKIHMFAVNALDTIEALNDYDFLAGWPE